MPATSNRLTLARRLRAWVAQWERQGYANGIPDEAPANLEAMGKVPSYRRVCIAIMRNDVSMLSLGHSRPSCAIYTALKRDELRLRGTIPSDNQLRFPF